MTIDLDDIESRINEGIYGDDRMTDTGRDDAFAALAVLLDEVERLRGEAAQEREAERAAVVAYLRGKFPGWPMRTKGYADEIESGEHRCEEKE
jgi:hypothetical protein